MAVTRIKNNQITDSTIVGSAKIQSYTITGGLLANNLTYGSNFTVSGNLTVNGNTTTIDTNITTIEDPVIVLASTQTGSPAVDIGFIGERGTSENIAFVWDESQGKFITAFTNTNETETTITVSSYASFKTLDAEVTGNLSVTGTSGFTGNITTGNISVGANKIIDAGNNKISNVAEPLANADVATKSYVDSQVSSGVSFDITDGITTETIINGDTITFAGVTNETTVTVSATDTVTIGLPDDVIITGNLTANKISSNSTVSATGNVTGGNITTSGNVDTVYLNATNSITGANLLTGGLVSAGGNITGGNVNTGGQVSATGNVTGGNVNTGGLVSATGNVTGGNLLTSGQVSATGNVSGGNVITNTIVAPSGNLSLSNANLQSVTDIQSSGNITASSGQISASTMSAAGNVTGGNVLTGGIVSAAGTVTGGNLATGGTVSATGNVTGGNILTSGYVSATGNINGGGAVFTGNISAPNFLGNVTGNISGNLTVSGSNTQVLFNDDGLANASAGFTFNKTSNLMTVTGNISGGNISTDGTVSVLGNIIGGNINSVTAMSAGGNIAGGNLTTAGLVSAGGNVTGGNVNTAGQVSAAGNVTGGNINTAGLISTSGNVAANNLTVTNYANVGYLNVLNGPSSFQGNVGITGNLLVAGNVTYIGVQDLTVDDPIIYLAANNVADLDDIGFVGNWDNGLYQHGGLVRDHTDGIWKFFSNVVAEPTTVVDWANALFDTVQVGSLKASGNISGNVAISATGNVIGGNLLTGGLITATGNVTGGNVLTGGYVSAVGNVIGGNLTTAGQISATGNINGTGAVFTGNVTAANFIGNVVGNISGNITVSGSNTQVLFNDSGLANATSGFTFDKTANLLTVAGNVIGANFNTAGQVSATGNVTGGNVNTAGNVTGGNVLTGGLISATGTVTSAANVIGGNLTTGGQVSATGTITGGNFNTGGAVSATGNITGGNVNTVGNISASYFIGNGSLLTGIDTTQIQSGTSNVKVAAVNGNVTTSVNGTSNVVVVNAAGGDVNGYWTATGNVSGGNITTGGSVSATGNVTANGAVYVGNVSATNFIGNVVGNISGNITVSGSNTQVLFNDSGLANATSGMTFDKTANLFTVAGNVAGGNITTASGQVSAGGNITGANLLTGGLISATGNVTGGNITTAAQVSAGGNITGANVILTSGTVDGPAAGRITVNGSSADTDFAVNADTVANVFYVDAGTGTASFGSATQTTNALVAFNATNSILLPVGNTAQRPAVGVTGMIRFNTTTDDLEVYDADGWKTAGAPPFTVIVDDQFNGDGSTTAFVLSQAATTAGVVVSINGVVQIPTTAYSVSSTTLTFTEAPLSGDVIDVRIITTTSTITSIENASGNASVTPSENSAAVLIEGNLLPTSNATYSIGSTSSRWVDATLSGNIVAATVKTTPVTVAGLPSAATVGAGTRAFVTDADSAAFANLAVGGGGNSMPVFSNGTNWYIG